MNPEESSLSPKVGLKTSEREESLIAASQGATRPTRFALVFAACLGTVYTLALLINFLGNGPGTMPSPLVPCRSERAWKTRRIEHLTREGRPPRLIVMGSSRVMQIRPDHLKAITGKDSFNYGVSLGCPVDFLTQLRFLIKIGARPELLVVGTEEFAFGDSLDYDFYDVQLAGHAGLLPEIPWFEQPRIDLAVVKSVSVSTTRKSVANLRSRPRRPAPNHEALDILLSDGYRLTPKLSVSIRDGDFRLDSGLETSLKFWTRAFPTDEAAERMRPVGRRLGYFVELLELARTNGIEVRVMYLPLQPTFVERFFSPRRTAIRLEVRDAVARACGQHGALFRDLSDLGSFHGDPEGFSDGTHAIGDNLRKMVNVLFGLPPDHVAASLPDDLELIENLPPTTTMDTL